MKNFRLLKGRRGYVLPWVIILFLLVSLLSTVIVSAAAVSVRSTKTHHSARQAYYSARSAAAAVVNYILANGHDPDALAVVMDSVGTGSNSLLGDYTVEVHSLSENRLKVTAKAVYEGEQSTVTATLLRLPGQAGASPSDNLVFLGGSAAAGFGQGSYNGDVYVNGDFAFGNGSTMNGQVVVTGNTHISGWQNTDLKKLISFGDVTLTGSGSVAGDVYTPGNVYMDRDSSSIRGDLYADGSLHMQNGSARIEGNAVIGGDAFFGGGGNRIRGSLSYGGSTSVAYGSIDTFVGGGATKLDNYVPLDLSGYKGPSALPVVSPPTPAENPQLYLPLSISNRTVSQSGTINTAVMSLLASNSYGATITIDTSAGDISLLVKDTHFFVDHGFKYEITGGNHVYLYLTGSASMTLGANQYMGMQVRGSNPRLFIIGDGPQQVTVTSNAALNACVYLPRGKFIANGSHTEAYKLVGVVMADQVSIDSNVKLQFSSVDLTDTPLSVVAGGGDGGAGGGTPGGWTLEGWDNR